MYELPDRLCQRFCGVCRHKHVTRKSFISRVFRNKTKIPVDISDVNIQTYRLDSCQCSITQVYPDLYCELILTTHSCNWSQIEIRKTQTQPLLMERKCKQNVYIFLMQSMNEKPNGVSCISLLSVQNLWCPEKTVLYKWFNSTFYWLELRNKPKS